MSGEIELLRNNSRHQHERRSDRDPIAKFE
jgi:hypothetical protein